MPCSICGGESTEVGQNIKTQEAGTCCTIIVLLKRWLQQLNFWLKKKKFVIQGLLYSPDLLPCDYYLFQNGDERSILWWYWSHTNCCDEGCWGSPKDGLNRDIHPCIGSACPAVHWCTRGIFWINILNSGKIWYLYFVFKKFDFFSNTLCTSHCLPKSSQREEVIPKNEKWTPALALWQFDSTKCN